MESGSIRSLAGSSEVGSPQGSDMLTVEERNKSSISSSSPQEHIMTSSADEGRHHSSLSGRESHQSQVGGGGGEKVISSGEVRSYMKSSRHRHPIPTDSTHMSENSQEECFRSRFTGSSDRTTHDPSDAFEVLNALPARPCSVEALARNNGGL